MDFVEGLPKSKGKFVIMVVVEQMTKYSHFLPLAHPYSAETVAQLFYEQVFRLHGLPQSIVCDRDPIFTSHFWTELFKLQGTRFNFSSANHPQTYGQTEVVNRTLEMVSREQNQGTGCVGCLGQSIVITLVGILPSRPPLLKLCMEGHHRTF